MQQSSRTLLALLGKHRIRILENTYGAIHSVICSFLRDTLLVAPVALRDRTIQQGRRPLAYHRAVTYQTFPLVHI